MAGVGPTREVATPKESVEEPLRPIPEDQPDPGEEREARALRKALEPVVSDLVIDTLRKNPKLLVDLLAPVIGRAIRASITDALSGLTASVEAQAANVFSPKRLSWRWEAFRSGKTYGEVLVSRSLIFRVDQLLLIHKQTGLVLNDLAASADSERDADLISSMLSAIDDFAHDSFGLSEEESLSSFTLGELTIVVNGTSQVMLAAAIVGNATPELQATLGQAVEEIHEEYYDELAGFDGSTDGFEQTSSILERCLIRKAADGVTRISP